MRGARPRGGRARVSHQRNALPDPWLMTASLDALGHAGVLRGLDELGPAVGSS